MPKLLRTIKRLKNPSDLWLFLQILSMLTLLPWQIRRLSLPELLSKLSAGVSPSRRDEERLRKTVGFVDSLLKYRFFQRYGTCLLRSLVLFKFLRRQGWPVELHFGVRKAGADAVRDRISSQPVHFDITGHSWLVLMGEPFLEDRGHAAEFATTYRFPPAAS